MQIPSFSKVVNALALAAVVGLGGAFGYSFFRAELAASMYRRKLEDVAGEYKKLATTYNEAVRRTAVTELNVEKGKLAVRIRGLDGVLQEIPTPFNPKGEVYIDYVVIDNRLWIRRVFDASTPPDKGLVVDPRFINVEWDSQRARYGKAVYRTLDEGRWVVTVTGDGSLGLVKVDGPEPIALKAAPEVRDYDEIVEEVEKETGSIGPTDVWHWLRERK
jgi:hypothetical protein